MAGHILLAEDDKALSALMQDFFRAAGVQVTPAYDGGQALALAQEHTFDLLVLDVMMPHLNGLEVCAAVRRESDVPVIFVTALGQEGDTLAGFRAGADDYVTKPFSLAVLRARVKNLLRPRRGQGDGVYRQGPFVFDFARMEFSRGGRAVELSRTEQRLLRLLVENRGRVLTRARLLDAVWDGGGFVDENALSVAMRRLRAKLTDPPVRTVYGVGYLWEAEL